MRKLYQGELPHVDAAGALKELQQARAELSRLPVRRLVGNIEDRSKRPPWGDDIASTITDLSNYFVTSTGRDVFATVQEILEVAVTEGGPVAVVNY